MATSKSTSHVEANALRIHKGVGDQPPATREVFQVLASGTTGNYSNTACNVGKGNVFLKSLPNQENNGPLKPTAAVFPKTFLNAAAPSSIPIYSDENLDTTNSNNVHVPPTIRDIPTKVQPEPVVNQSQLHLQSTISSGIEQQHHSRNPLQDITGRTQTLLEAGGNGDGLFDIVDYQRDILDYLKSAELRFRPNSDYMRKQPDITNSMRTVLVDWIVEVCEEYRLNAETLYLSVLYVDRFLSYMSVVRNKLQLVGTSAMFIAAKFEEIYPPDVADFVYITDDTYTKKQVLRMEQLILKVLSFDMSAPTPYAFINLYTVIEQLPDKVKHMAMFLCELSLLHAAPFLQYLPSRIAAAAVAYARLLFDFEGLMWTRSLELMTGYELSHLRPVIFELNHIHSKCQQSVQKAIYEKYKAPKYSEVAVEEPVALTENMFERTHRAITKELEEAVKVMKM